MGETAGKYGMGWLPDYPDFHYYTVDKAGLGLRLKQAGQTDSVKDMLTKLKVAKIPVKLPATVDLRPWYSPIEDQKSLGSCTANAGVGIVEYFERRAFGNHIDGSRLFLYKVTRKLLHLSGDTGASISATMGGLALFGVPPEEYWPYRVDPPFSPDEFDEEPPAFCYAFAQSYQAITYYKYDPPGTTPDVVLGRVKTNLAAGLPAMFGFVVYSSISQAGTTGKIPFPAAGERVLGGHAIDVAGYDDTMKIKNTNPGGRETTGAFLIRNSWGTGWGDHGYGWFPYDYVTARMAVDWWSLLKNEYVGTGQFGL